MKHENNKANDKIGDSVKVSSRICPIHGTYLWESVDKVKPINSKDEKYIVACPTCTKEKNLMKSKQTAELETVNMQLAQTYGMLRNKSLIPTRLIAVNFGKFQVKDDEDKRAKDFGLYLCDYYFKKGGEGNAIIVGSYGVGKSFLSMCIADKLNEDCRAVSDPKKILFISVPQLFRKMETAKSYEDTKENYRRWLRLMIDADYLFLDDFGKESTFGNLSKEATADRQKFFYDLFDSRVKPIIFNTNFSGKQLKKIYDGALVSRMSEGVGRNVFKFSDEATDKRRNQ